ncbi:uncharacterized protein DUF4932 [Mucilaginibacter gracilis]|uniref:Uncharacterized protein DUF4932 n=1 Tax=Mucilaginibacter gracilis TaxID=423350 RepID=A0A495IXC3_9SPHI|nr:DUF4932 domain-containing protein [Mucilaginibacter gracilis]RKR80529.1 uncharacterized protein DUF4932 [Mucilaginibacter gracilis]
MKKIFLSLWFLTSTTLLFAQDGNVNFTPRFQQKNKGKYKIEINEVKELIHIMIAITKFGLGNDDMIQQKGAYYQYVLRQFKPYQNEPVIATFDSLLKQSPLNYVFLTGNAISYNFSQKKLVPDEIFILPADEVSTQKITVNPITTYKAGIEHFAEISGFRTFFATHKNFYKELVTDYEKNGYLKKQWKWLEKNFNTKIANYQILCSPLINGLNYTFDYGDSNFKMIQMVLPPLDHNEQWSPAFTEAMNTKGMFTEIDHNYVRKPSNDHEMEINAALKERKKWVDTTYGTEYYQNPVKVFNEYMTFGVFILYCEDIFKNDTQTLRMIYKDVNEVMSKQRGFIKMPLFNDYLTSLRKRYPNRKIDDLYPELLQWCAAQ